VASSAVTISVWTRPPSC